MKRILVLLMFSLSWFIVSCDEECSSGVFDECGVCDGPGKVPENEDDCAYVTQCQYVNVELGSDSYCSGGCSNMNGNYCESNPDCYYSGGFAGLGCNDGHHCVKYQQEYVCEDVYECNSSVTYVCPD